MLGPGRYLLGVLEILWLGGFAWLGGAALRKWLLPRFDVAPAHLATAVIALALLLWPAELLGSFGAWDPLPYLLMVAVVGSVLWKVAPRPPERGRSHLDRTAHSCGRGGALRRWGEDAPVDGHDRLRQHLVPRAFRCRVLPEREYVGPALHRPAVPGLVLPGQRRNLPRDRDAGVRSRRSLAAAEPRMVRRLPRRLLVHRAAVQGGAVVARARSDSAQRSSAGRSGGGGEKRHRRDLLSIGRRGYRPERLGRKRGSGKEAG